MSALISIRRSSDNSHVNTLVWFKGDCNPVGTFIANCTTRKCYVSVVEATGEEAEFLGKLFSEKVKDGFLTLTGKKAKEFADHRLW